jgi:hypothetical protein
MADNRVVEGLRLVLQNREMAVKLCLTRGRHPDGALFQGETGMALVAIAERHAKNLLDACAEYRAASIELAAAEKRLVEPESPA